MASMNLGLVPEKKAYSNFLPFSCRPKLPPLPPYALPPWPPSRWYPEGPGRMVCIPGTPGGRSTHLEERNGDDDHLMSLGEGPSERLKLRPSPLLWCLFVMFHITEIHWGSLLVLSWVSSIHLQHSHNSRTFAQGWPVPGHVSRWVLPGKLAMCRPRSIHPGTLGGNRSLTLRDDKAFSCLSIVGCSCMCCTSSIIIHDAQLVINYPSTIHQLPSSTIMFNR